MTYKELREILIDYYGSASFIFPMSLVNVVEIETADHAELLELAREAGFRITSFDMED